jgi:hypothetical protein
VADECAVFRTVVNSACWTRRWWCPRTTLGRAVAQVLGVLMVVVGALAWREFESVQSIDRVTIPIGPFVGARRPGGYERLNARGALVQERLCSASFCCCGRCLAS